MCCMSMVMDWQGDNWRRRLDDLKTQPFWPPLTPQITPAEVEEFRDLLERARKYDAEHQQPDCELESKRERLRDLAKELGVEITFA